MVTDPICLLLLLILFSGCVTSAETVLIAQQSQEELYKILETNKLVSQYVNNKKYVLYNVLLRIKALIKKNLLLFLFHHNLVHLLLSNMDCLLMR